MEFRKGDVVSVEGVVDFTSGGQVYFKVGGQHVNLGDDNAGLVLIARRFEVGEVVRSKHEPTHPAIRYEVLAVDGDQVWLKRTDSGKRVTLNAKDLEAAPPATVGFETEAFPIGETFVGGLRVPPKLNGDVPPAILSPSEIEYITAEGDTLAAMAYVFATSVDTIKTLNNEILIGFPADEPFRAGFALKITDNRIPF
jgi:hypothetical protein